MTLPVRVAGLVDDLRSPDPAVRDDGAYHALAVLAGDGALDEHLIELGDRAAALLTEGTVQARSFGALLLALVVDRDTRTRRGGGDESTHQWLAAACRWYPAEPDTRGWNAGLGWLHAVAHGADALGELAASPRSGRDDLALLLDTLVARAVESTDQHWLQDEDDRVALAVMAVLLRDVLGTEEVRGAIARLSTGWIDAAAGPVPAVADNCVRLARTLHLQLTLGVRPEPGAAVRHPAVRAEALRALGAALADLHWFYGDPA
jgi:hypothetical protein